MKLEYIDCHGCEVVRIKPSSNVNVLDIVMELAMYVDCCKSLNIQ
jgi:hypothetical protein